MAVETGAAAGRDLGGHFGWFERSRIPIWSWIVLIWALFVFPAISLRAYHYEEGYVVAVARGVIEDSNGIVPHFFGYRFVERPNLMAWTVAALGALSGGVNQWVARAPTVLSLLAGCFLVFHLVRRYAGALAALFGAMCFIVSPMMLQKLIVAEPDCYTSVILFGTLIVWWNGIEKGDIGPLRWLAIGALLTTAALVKGPQPIAYFGLGAAAFHLVRRQWLHLMWLSVPALMAGLVSGAWYWAVYQPGDIATWIHHSRLGETIPVEQRIFFAARFVVVTLLETLPALILAAPFAYALERPGASRSNDLTVALLLYSVCCTAILVFWPGANGRYVMPAMPALAALAGLAFDRYRSERPRLVNAALMVGTILAAYQIALCWLVMPAAPGLFDRNRSAALVISAAIAARPATLYVPAESYDNNVLGYIDPPLRIVPLEDFRDLTAPAWALTSIESHEQRIRELRPDLDIAVRAVVLPGVNAHLLDLRAK